MAIAGKNVKDTLSGWIESPAWAPAKVISVERRGCSANREMSVSDVDDRRPTRD
jgi:hypothetical protein